METIRKKRLTTKDLIAIGIYNAVIFVLIAAVGMLTGIVPVLYLFLYAISTLIVGPVFMLMVSKSPKKGTILISGILQGLIWSIMGLWYMVIFTSIGGLIAELAANRADYSDKKGMLLSFVLFILGFYGGSFGIILLFSEYYMSFSVELGGETAYVESIVHFIKGPVGIIAFAATLLGTLVGGIFGQKFQAKHFNKGKYLVNE